MVDPLPVAHPLRTASLSSRRPTLFDLAPTDPQRQALALILGVSALPVLRFTGSLAPTGPRDFTLDAHLVATVVQPCVVTLAPVTTRIETQVRRHYLADFPEPHETESQVHDDADEEPLPEVIDIGAVLTEAIALALPDYPRASGAELAETVVAPPGVTPLRDGDLKPFAGLQALARKLSGEGPDEAGGSGQ